MGRKHKPSSHTFELRSNLKLVHIVCHDKGCHKGKVCDRTKFYQ